MDLKSTPFLYIPTIAHDVQKRAGKDETIYISSNIRLGTHPQRISERLIHWAETKPHAVFLGQRNRQGKWVKLSYAQCWKKVQKLSQYLLEIGVSEEKPIAILSGNSIEHALLALAALHIGIPYSPISPAYSTKSRDFSKLKHCIGLLTPGLIFVQDGQAFGKAISAAADGIKVLAVDHVMEGQEAFHKALESSSTGDVQKAYEKVDALSIAKILFTSGSTGLPKGVINTHGNICTNWQQITQTFPFMRGGAGIRLIDWLPWNHVFGGNHNFGITLYNGGSLYIDDGNPTPQGIQTTLKNLADIAPTVYFNVPKGFEELINALKTNKKLCKFFFSELKMFFYAGASMPHHVWEGLEQLAYDTIGKRLLISTGLGMTEASPSCLFNTQLGSKSGHIGVPVPGLEVKLVPDGDKMEARFKGANLTPGYWRNPEATAKAFDEEGFYKTGDALRLIDENDYNKGMKFDGRIAEDFKLNTGTWVSVGVLKEKLIQAGKGLIQDVVITGHDRAFLGAIIFPELKYCRNLSALPETASLLDILAHPQVIKALDETIQAFGAKSTGSSTCVRRAIFADFELSIDKGEITDKGSINQRAILKNKADIIELLYQEEVPMQVITYKKKPYVKLK